ncbi:MAG: trimethylamine methyltransferase family protein [Syntrophobacteraceae bacterium]
MDSKGLSGVQYRPLSDEQVKIIHEAALTILETTGFTYESGLDGALELLETAGAEVDRASARIRFPRDLVVRETARAPERVVLYSRDGRNDLDLTEHRVHLGTGGAAIRILDLETGKARSSTLQDVYQLARLVDRLDHVHFYLRPCIPTDISESAYDANVYYACMKGTTKHVMAGVNDVEGLHRVADLASIIAGGYDRLRKKPFVSVITSFAISPLKFCTQSTLIMLEAARNHIPVALSCAPMSGSTAPLTMAATLAQIHAEQMAGLTLCQLAAPGSPQLYGGIPGMANLRTMGYLGGAVECGMMNAAIHQMSHHIGVPNYNSSGLTDSKIPDIQAGWEKALTTVLAAMGGSNYIHHAAGMLESMLAVAYEQFVIDDEIIGMCCKVLRGIEVDGEHLALEVIDAVGPGSNFMTAEHTMKHMHGEHFEGNGVTDRKSRVKWEKDGSLDARERARTIARRILSAEEEPCISEAHDRAIREKYEILL